MTLMPACTATASRSGQRLVRLTASARSAEPFGWTASRRRFTGQGAQEDMPQVSTGYRRVRVRLLHRRETRSTTSSGAVSASPVTAPNQHQLEERVPAMREWFEDLSDTMRVFAIGVILLFAVGAVWLAWVNVFAPQFQDQQRRQFERSKSHQSAVVQDLTDRCADLATATDPAIRRAIVVVIAQRAATEDLSQLQMSADVRTCVTNAQNEYVNGGK